MLTTAPAVVVIGNHTQGLGIVRSAGAAGASVWVVNDKRLSLVRFSRWLSGYRLLSRGTLSCLEQKAAADELCETLRNLPVEGPAVLMGVDEDIVSFIHRNRAELGSRFFIPAIRMDVICDKFQFMRLVPEAARIETRLWSETDVASLPLPQQFLVKGRTGNSFRRATGQKAIRLDHFKPSDREQLFRQMAPDQVVVQSLVTTDRPVISVCSFSIGGRMVGVFGYEKLRQHPNRFGTGTFLRSVSVEHLRPLAENILQQLYFTGISEIEFIHDAETGAYKVVEMNPRTWKSVHFATQCGVNLVGQLLTHMRGEPVTANATYLRDRFWVDLATDIPQMFRERRLWGYPARFFECVWNRSDLLPGVALWTLFPLMALEGMLPAKRRTHAMERCRVSQVAIH